VLSNIVASGHVVDYYIRQSSGLHGFCTVRHNFPIVHTFKKHISEPRLHSYESTSSLINTFGNENICTDDCRTIIPSTTFYPSTPTLMSTHFTRWSLISHQLQCIIEPSAGPFSHFLSPDRRKNKHFDAPSRLHITI
jgi:hypothetical protein